MSEQTYLVMLALADEPRHGYGVVREVKALSGGRVALGAGTLYGVLDRLVERGWAQMSDEVVVDGRLRRYYRLTDEGLAEVTAETDRLRELASRARRILSVRPARPALGRA
ncbi:PadR family transcriptional regulator [Cellulomonas palmilytica]|uniref:PadR family transcriptional regulator n=1 Tax=Cellulomonas palmilytica TaxID=2608402 RepID=UPI001F2B4141|nr:PadR family transcriptional regulator [Cellulomonas palmilytica]UJP40075.1 helix-turn-helix transcriptional regulator [Cellulomonas palmilytica]